MGRVALLAEERTIGIERRRSALRDELATANVAALEATLEAIMVVVGRAGGGNDTRVESIGQGSEM